MATLAPSLIACRIDVNVRWPNRDTGSDGWIGDPAHASRPSDHNPGARGLVHALDIDEDISGVDREDGKELFNWLDSLRIAKDPRIKYVIYEGRMFSSYATRYPAWTWRPYTGVNLHTRHGHISIHSTISAETDTSTWFPASAPKPTPDDIEEDSMVIIRTRTPNRAAALVAGRMLAITGEKNAAEATKAGIPVWYVENDEWDRFVKVFGPLVK